MKLRKDARKKLQEENKDTIKSAIESQVREIREKGELDRQRRQKIDEKSQEREANALDQQQIHVERIRKSREDELLRKKRIQEEKLRLQSKRKQAWNDKLLKNGRLEALGGKREENLKLRERQWELRKNTVSMNRATYMSRFDSLLKSTAMQMGQDIEDDKFSSRRPGKVEPSTSDEDQDSFVIDLTIETSSPIRNRGRPDVETPVTPQDFFDYKKGASPFDPRSSDEHVEEGRDEGEGNDDNDNDHDHHNSESENNVNESNDANAKAKAEAESDVAATEGGRTFRKSDHIFSPLSPGMKRGYSFTITPTRIPLDEEIEKMSPLQRTYTTLKMKRGEDPGILRMKELIRHATG